MLYLLYIRIFLNNGLFSRPNHADSVSHLVYIITRRHDDDVRSDGAAAAVHGPPAARSGNKQEKKKTGGSLTGSAAMATALDRHVTLCLYKSRTNRCIQGQTRALIWFSPHNTNEAFYKKPFNNRGTKVLMGEYLHIVVFSVDQWNKEFTLAFSINNK